MATTIAEKLVRFTLETEFDRLPREVVEQATYRLIDTFGCAAGALGEPAPTFARTATRRVSGQPSSGLFGGGASAPDWAAFSNGVHIRYLDCNDTYLSLEPAHPSDNWAAIFAAGESVGASGRDWITAAAIAYEVQCRLCDAASIRRRGWDHTTYGNLSACLAAAKLLGLGREQMTHALGIAGTTSAALRISRAGELSMWKGCAFAHAARNGVFAALLAREGITGPAPLFEGEMGFFEQVSGPFELEQLGGTRAVDWMLPRTSIKFVPAEYHSQSAIAAAFALRDRVPDPSQIRAIEIATFRTAVEIIAKDPEKWHPQTRETADHSLPYCTVVALLDGEITARQFSDARLRDPLVLDLLARTSVIEEPELTAAYPASVPNRVRITLLDGAVVEESVAHPPGHDKNPLSLAGLRTKYDGLMRPAIGDAKADELWQRLLTIASDPEPHRSIGYLAI
jgi:2-methylcitrate dehydratase